MKLHEALGIRRIVEGPLFGIECETEGANLPDISDGKWKAVHDGSLRDGMEYVTDGGIPIKDVKSQITKLHAFIKRTGGVPNYSFRCSTHVHCNVQDLDDLGVVNCIFSYMLFENVFMNFVDKSRVGNRFCLRFQDAQQLTSQVCKFVEALSFGTPAEERYPNAFSVALMTLNQEQLKYAALNIYTLRKYGTLEFRALEGTNDAKRIETWCQAIYNWRMNAEKYKTPRELYEAFLQKPTAMAMEIFGHAPEQFLKEGWQEQVEEGYSQNMAVLMYI